MEIMNKEWAPERKHHKLPLSSRGPDKDFPNNRKMEEFRLNNVKKRFNIIRSSMKTTQNSCRT